MNETAGISMALKVRASVQLWYFFFFLLIFTIYQSSRYSQDSYFQIQIYKVKECHPVKLKLHDAIFLKQILCMYFLTKAILLSKRKNW